MNFLMNILSIVLFLIALGVLVAIHEAGHFFSAKMFNVYCSDFSIGFGWKFLKISREETKIFGKRIKRKKEKNIETAFSLGIVPFGGYVSIYGEGIDLPEGITVPKSRSLEGISRWKKIIIFSGGILMNFVLAYLIFLISASCFPQLTNDFRINSVKISDESAFKVTFPEASEDILNSNDLINFSAANVYYEYNYLDSNGKTITVPVNGATILFTDSKEEANQNYTLTYGTDWGYNDTEYSNLLEFLAAKPYTDSSFSNVKIYGNDKDGKTILVDIEETPYKDINFNLPIVGTNNSFVEYKNEENKDLKPTVYYFKDDNKQEIIPLDANFRFNEGKLEKTGISAYAQFEYVGWDSFRIAGENWLEANTAISDALGKLFSGDKSTWEGVGGPVAIFSQTTQILSNFPFNYYLETWGIISVNLALFNLLPFPGLDGWQILVEIIEGTVNFGMKAVKKTKKDKNKPQSNNEVIETEVINEGQNDEIIVGKPKKEIEENDWKIPQKIKNIVSSIGLILLFGFMIIILFKDIFTLF